jgi:multiple sugar transport system permease protein
MSRPLSWPAAVSRHAALILLSLAMLSPFVWMVSLSLKPANEIFQNSLSLLPHHWYAAENFTRALTAAPLPRYMANGVFVCLSVLALQLLVCVPCAYALAKIDFRGHDLLFGLVLVGLLLPRQVLALPMFILCYSLGILDSYAALILPFAVSPFGIFLFRQFFKTIPDDLVHAARLDGLSESAIVWRIMVPMALPAIAAFAIFSTVAHWNELFWPLIAIKTPSLMPPALGVAMFRGAESGADHGPMMAGAILVILPLILGFLAAQRYFIGGLTSASLK